MKVSEVMTLAPVTVTPDKPLGEAAEAMLDAGVSGLPVVDEQGRLVGIVTEADFLAEEAKRERRSRRLLDVLFGDERLSGAERVADIMSPDPMTVGEGAPLPSAARLMVENNVKRLPVVDEGGRLVGIVSRADVLQAFAQSDEAVAGRVQAFLARSILPIDPSAVEVTVANGVVTLQGVVENREDAEAFEHIVGFIDGVLRVDSRLTWQVDEARQRGWPGYAQEGAEP